MNARQTAIGLTLLTLTIAAGVPARAQAQVNGQIGSAPIDLQIFRPAADTKGYITLNGAQILAPLDLSFGLIGTGGWRPLDLDASAAECHLARLVPVPDRDAFGVVLALRADHIDDFLFHQLGQHPEPNTDAQGEQPLLRSADQLAERLLHPRRQHGLGRAERYGFLLHGGSSFDLWRIASNAPSSGTNPASSSRTITDTAAPRASKDSTQALPMPDAAPETRAISPAKRPRFWNLDARIW